jgi:hypothetical protein
MCWSSSPPPYFDPSHDSLLHGSAEQTLGLPLDEFIAVAIQGLQQVAPDIGL